MTRAEREMLVEKYLAFEMSSEHEQEFIMQAAVDGELRQILRTSRLVDRALEKNRDANPPAGHIDVRQHALALLAATPPPTPALPAEALRPVQHRPRGGSWFAIATTAVIFSVAGFLGRDLVETDRQRNDVVQPAAVTGGENRQMPVDSSSSLPAEATQADPVVPRAPSASQSATPIEKGLQPPLRYRSRSGQWCCRDAIACVSRLPTNRTIRLHERETCVILPSTHISQ